MGKNVSWCLLENQFESGSLSKGREYLLITNSFLHYIDVQFFSTFWLSCSCSSLWLYNEGKMECTFHLSPLPCFPFCSVLDIWPAAHLPDISQIPTHVTDTGRLYLMVLVCLNRSPLCWIMHNAAVSQAEAVSESRKKKRLVWFVCLGRKDSMFIFFFSERLFYSVFQIQFKCILIVILFFSQMLM